MTTKYQLMGRIKFIDRLNMIATRTRLVYWRLLECQCQSYQLEVTKSADGRKGGEEGFSTCLLFIYSEMRCRDTLSIVYIVFGRFFCSKAWTKSHKISGYFNWNYSHIWERRVSMATSWNRSHKSINSSQFSLIAYLSFGSLSDCDITRVLPERPSWNNYSKWLIFVTT